MRKTLLGMAIAGASCVAGAADFTLGTPDIAPEKMIAEKHLLNSFGCTGSNLSPTLAWKNMPPGTKSLAVTVNDPDAPTGSGWWHWIIYDIPAHVTELPSGIGNSDKPHGYIFPLHALSIPKHDVPADASGALVGYMIRMNEITKTQFVAHYGR